jgi:hypothetical protein
VKIELKKIKYFLSRTKKRKWGGFALAFIYKRLGVKCHHSVEVYMVSYFFNKAGNENIVISKK